MDLISHRTRSYFNASIFLTKADNYCKITSKYDVKTYVNSLNEARTRILLLVCLMP